MGMIACTDCGQQIGENALFCPNCGSAAGLYTMIKRFLRWGVITAMSVLGIMAAIAIVMIVIARSFGG